MKAAAMQRNISRSLELMLENAQASASSSKNERLNAARAGIERNGSTAPGSVVPLTAHGLLAGTMKEAERWFGGLPSNDKLLLKKYKEEMATVWAWGRTAPMREPLVGEDMLSAEQQAIHRSLLVTVRDGPEAASLAVRGQDRGDPSSGFFTLNEDMSKARELEEDPPSESSLGLNEEDRNKAHELERKYQLIFVAEKGGSHSRVGSTARARPVSCERSPGRETTGQLCLNKVDLKRMEDTEKWQREHGLHSWPRFRFG